MNTRKGVLIPHSLFFMIYAYFIHGAEEYRDVISEGLEKKLGKMVKHDLYTKSKIAETEEERKAARREYLDRVGVPESFRF